MTSDNKTDQTVEQPSQPQSDKDADVLETSEPTFHIFSTVSCLHSPDFATQNWVLKNGTSWESDSHRKGTTLSNVQFRNCQQSGLILDRCLWQNVTIINCKFRNTTFREVTLIDVTLQNLDFEDSKFCELHFENVTLCKVNFRNDIWRNTMVQHAFLHEQSFIEQHFSLEPFTYNGCGIVQPSPTSKTKLGTTPSLLPKEGYGRPGTRRWRRDIHYVHYVRSWTGTLSGLVAHKMIWNRIMEFCFPGDGLHIYEYPEHPGGFATPGDQPLYSVIGNNFLHGREATTTHKKAYFGSLQSNTPATGEFFNNLPHRGVTGCPNLMSVSKELTKLTREHLFDRTIHFQCSAAGAENFLSAHVEDMKSAKEIVLYYHWPKESVVIATDDERWRKLLATLRHELSFIPRMRIHIGRHFWTESLWRQGAWIVFMSVPNPFRGLAKVAAPEERWVDLGSMECGDPACQDGTVLELDIEGTESKEQVAFVEQLIAKIDLARADRPLFVRTGYSDLKYKTRQDFY